ncbi:Inositol 2-dehydrogenase/D-chiro-inositol 3-dehydrogenase [Paenibacillus allorhizoplanae]|uniref:Inositol 2-dehydrogenase/D-chiro-inositol 3-dehydrogenase n=1 Tax=Paenibacillus allorhizoplanae TaxID=2905648 RepID=A0ABM9C3V0_9BACL|nr:Gfo/Idh/MocA family oxidoreductase [Paenibacillus allorhizoplanae]CAH1201781.1 Inositol 2-dehydrogenase/D-chiro-inositol 3-dehydrogenase [Paenibacillus allorhizoplanae]
MKIGVIGYGLRISHVIKEVLKADADCRIEAIVDVRKDQIKAKLLEQGWDHIKYYDTPEQMLETEQLDGAMIGTRCNLHTTMGLKVLQHDLPLYIEKPVATNYEDLLRLKQGYEASKSPAVVSFPLRVTSIVELVKEIIQSGKIGTVEHVQAINNVPYGRVYFQSWYRNEVETGGLFLQKATHDLDYIQAILGQRPITVCAMTSKQIFKGNKSAGLKCVDCEDNRTCLESTVHSEEVLDPTWQYCCYAEDTGNEDSGSALFQYESGMHMSYSQNFFIRKGAAARGARFMGYKGTVDFDFYTGIVKVHMHHTARVETYEIGAGSNHFGGDEKLARNFTEIMKKTASSISTLDDGLMSALMCIKAQESAKTGTFQTLNWE